MKAEAGGGGETAVYRFRSMLPIRSADDIPLDYLQGYYAPAGPRALAHEYVRGRYFIRKR